jgi:seryl-tRNA(Sec) selenium transferase
VDKVVIAAMQAVMRSYLFGDDGETPTLSLAVESVEVLRRRAEAIARGLAKSVGESCQVGVVDDDAALGGGSFAVQQVPSVALVFRCPTDGEASSLALRMRNGTIPILCRIKGNEVRLNMRAILPEDDGPLTEALNTLFE